MEIPKFDPSRPVQGHSGSVEPTRADRLPYLRLPVPLIGYGQGQYLQNFPTLVFNTPDEGSSWKFVVYV